MVGTTTFALLQSAPRFVEHGSIISPSGLVMSTQVSASGDHSRCEDANHGLPPGDFLEAATGVEPLMEVLQTFALAKGMFGARGPLVAASWRAPHWFVSQPPSVLS
jgi:hypothetical protein